MPYTSKINWKNELDNIRTLGKTGKTMVDVAKEYNVSRQRIKQVVDRYLPEWAEECGGAAKRQVAAEKYKLKHGIKLNTDVYKAQKLKFNRKKYNAIRVGYTWNINFGDLIFPTHCPILGIELDYFAESTVEASPSFDRIDSSLGYVAGNVHVLSWRANRIKNDGTEEEHRKIADYLNKLSTDSIV